MVLMEMKCWVADNFSLVYFLEAISFLGGFTLSGDFCELCIYPCQSTPPGQASLDRITIIAAFNEQFRRARSRFWPRLDLLQRLRGRRGRKKRGRGLLLSENLSLRKGGPLKQRHHCSVSLQVCFRSDNDNISPSLEMISARPRSK